MNSKRLVAGCQDFLQDTFKIVLDFIIAKSDDYKSSAFQGAITLPVGLSLVSVNFSIHFDDERGGVTIEINDVAKKDLLPAKMPSAKPFCAQSLPQDGLGFGHLPPKLFCQLYFFGRYSLSADNILLHHLYALLPLP